MFKIENKEVYMLECALVMVGGALGALIRYFATKLIVPINGFPLSTFMVNLVGSFLIGIFTAVVVKYSDFSLVVKHLLIVGFLGSLTTFSTFSLDLVKLFENGDFVTALMYLSLSIVIGFCFAFLGLKIIN